MCSSLLQVFENEWLIKTDQFSPIQTIDSEVFRSVGLSSIIN